MNKGLLALILAFLGLLTLPAIKLRIPISPMLSYSSILVGVKVHSETKMGWWSMILGGLGILAGIALIG